MGVLNGLKWGSQEKKQIFPKKSRAFRFATAPILASSFDFKAALRFNLDLVQDTVEVQCPYCAQMFELAIDTSVPDQQFTTDCEICCRPMLVFVRSEFGEVIECTVQAE